MEQRTFDRVGAPAVATSVMFGGGGKQQATYDMAARGSGNLAQRPQCVLLRSLRSPEGCGWLQGRGSVVLMLWYGTGTSRESRGLARVGGRTRRSPRCRLTVMGQQIRLFQATPRHDWRNKWRRSTRRDSV